MKKIMRNRKIFTEVKETAQELEREGRLGRTKNYLQHGSVSVYEHCIKVAVLSCRLAAWLHVTTDRKALIRGALLHDYFLYDWHEKNAGHRFHGLYHPRAALTNARKDYPITEMEANVILRHMFPLTPVPPVCREAWIVCLADKICATEETIKGREKKKNHIQR